MKRKIVELIDLLPDSLVLSWISINILLVFSYTDYEVTISTDFHQIISKERGGWEREGIIKSPNAIKRRLNFLKLS